MGGGGEESEEEEERKGVVDHCWGENDCDG